MFLVHLFFAHKVWMLTRKRYWWITVITLLFTLGQFALGIATFVSFVMDSSFEGAVFGGTGRLATAALSCAIVADWTITISLVIFLRAEKGSQSGLGFANKILGTLIFYTVNIGLLISMVDFIVLILQNVKFQSLNLYQLMFYEIVSDLYANSLLACLNMRSPPSNELPQVAKLHQSSRIVVHRQSTAPRPSSSIQGDELQDSSDTIEMDFKGRVFDGSSVTVMPGGQGDGTKYGGGNLMPPPNWGSKRVIASSDVVITKTTDRHVS